MEIILVLIIVIFIIAYRMNKSNNVGEFLQTQFGLVYEKYAPYSFKAIREKVKELGMEFTYSQYLGQVIIFGFISGVLSYLYFYSITTTIIYVTLAIASIPYLSYLRYHKIYSEFIFEQIQVYTTNVIMEFNTVESFVRALEGVYESGVLENPVKSDVKKMIDLAYENGSINESINYMNSRYDYHIVRNMHQLFLQITNEGSRDSSIALANLLIDIDMLVSSVYADRIERESFHKNFITFGIILYFMIMLVQYLVGVETYLQLLTRWYIAFMLHAIVLMNTYFLLSGEKYYYENVGAE